MSTIFISFTIIFSVVFVCGFSALLIQKYFFLNKFQMVLQLFKYFLDMSYDIIYQNNIIGYTSNGIREIPPDELETIERDFVKQTISLMGKRNIKQLTLFFGDHECLISHMIHYIRAKILADEISKMVEKKTIEGK